MVVQVPDNEKRNKETDRPPLVLVVDDEPALQETIAYSMRREGWAVESTPDGIEAIRLSRELQPDLIVLDVMLPGVDGLQVCRAIRSFSDVPVLFLSAKGEDVDRILGLEIGGDDYLTKPFVMRELIARVRANLRRSQRVPAPYDAAALIQDAAARDRRQAGPIEIDPEAHLASLRGEPLLLKPMEFELLRYFVEHPNVTLSREALLRNVWKYEQSVDTRTVDVHIRGLRQKIESDPSHPLLLETVRGYGYRLTVPPD